MFHLLCISLCFDILYSLYITFCTNLTSNAIFSLAMTAFRQIFHHRLLIDETFLIYRSKFGTWQNQFKSFKKNIFVSLADCGGIINISEDNTKDVIITSPNYPDPYNSKQECSWTIMVCVIQDSFNGPDQRVFPNTVIGVVFNISCLADFISLLINGDLLLILFQ